MSLSKQCEFVLKLRFRKSLASRIKLRVNSDTEIFSSTADSMCYSFMKRITLVTSSGAISMMISDSIVQPYKVQ